MEETPNSEGNVTPIRNQKGQFVKGRSGNPSGRPSATFVDTVGNRFELSELYLANSGRVFVELLKLITASGTPASAKVSAIKEFNDRALGKAQNNIVVKREEAETEYDLEQLPVETLKQIANLKGRIVNGDE